MPNEFADLCTQTIQYLAPAGIDGYGKRTYAAPVAIKAHIQGEASEQTGPDGTTIAIGGTAWLDGHYPDLTTSGIITLPNGGGQRGLVTVQTVYGETGPHHTKLTYGQR